MNTNKNSYYGVLSLFDLKIKMKIKNIPSNIIKDDTLSLATQSVDEYDYEVPNQKIRGKIPESLRGTFFRIGPGRYEIGGHAFGHAFDGDGMLHSVTFTDHGVRYINRFVQTPKYMDETAAQKIVHRSLGHNIPGGPHKNIGKLPENCANTNLIWHGGHLLALWEIGRPYEIDPSTLETIGEFNYDGRLNLNNAFSAHGKIDPRTGNYYNFGLGLGIQGIGIHLYRIDPRGCLDRKGFIPIGGFHFCHDFALTEHYAIFFISPVSPSSHVKPILGLQTFMDCLKFESDKATQIFVISLDTFEVVKKFETEGFISVHFANCWEEKHELVINMTRFTDWERIHQTLSNPVKGMGLSENDKSGLWQYRLNLSNRKIHYAQLPGHDNIEFMQWDFRRTGVQTNITYANAAINHPNSFTLNAIQRQNLSTGQYLLHDFGVGSMVSEAVFVPREKTASEVDGYLITAVYRADSHHTDIVILHAETLDELAVIPLHNHIPVGFHCGYTSKAFR